MPRTNQGIFHEIRERVKNLENLFEDKIEIYFKYPNLDELYANTGNCWDPGHDFFTDFAYVANDIYSEAKELEKFIEYSLKTTKFELPSKKTDYENMLSKTSILKQNIVELFSNVLELYSTTCSISYMDQETLNKFSIYNDSRI